MITRRWASEHGGVWVESDQGMIFKPPAVVTNEISRLADKEANYRSRLTSRKPLDPVNEPDAFEYRALCESCLKCQSIVGCRCRGKD